MWWADLLELAIDWLLFDRWSWRGVFLVVLGVGICVLIITWPTSATLDLKWSNRRSNPDRILVGRRQVYPDAMTVYFQQRHPTWRPLGVSLRQVHQGDQIQVVYANQTIVHQVAGWHITAIDITPTMEGARFEYRHW